MKFVVPDIMKYEMCSFVYTNCTTNTVQCFLSFIHHSYNMILDTEHSRSLGATNSTSRPGSRNPVVM